MSILNDTKELLARNGLEMFDIPIYCRLYRKNKYPVSAMGTFHKEGTVTVYKGSLIYDGNENRILERDESFSSMEQATHRVANTNKIYWMLDWHSLNTTKCLGVYFKNSSPSKPYNEEEALEFWRNIRESTRKALKNKIRLGEEEDLDSIPFEDIQKISKDTWEYWKHSIYRCNHATLPELIEIQKDADNYEDSERISLEKTPEEGMGAEEGADDSEVDSGVREEAEKPHICKKYLISDFRQDVVLNHNDVSGMVSKFNRILKYNQNVLFLGPTGTGKSHLAEKLVDLHLGCSGSRKIYRVGRSNNLFINEAFLSVNRGTDLLKFIEISNNHPRSDFFIIVEDITDFDFCSVFSPIMTQMEKGKAVEVNLLGNTRIGLGDNLHFICTASESKESRYLLSESTKSRFGIIETEDLWGTGTLLKYVTERSLKQSAVDHFVLLDGIISRANKMISNNSVYLSRNFIGCRCILNKEKFDSDKDISDIISMELLPQYKVTLDRVGKDCGSLLDNLMNLVI